MLWRWSRKGRAIGLHNLFMCNVSGLDKPGAIERHYGHGYDIGSKEREDNGQCQGGKEIPAHPVEESNGKEHDRGSEGGREHGQLNLFATDLCRHLRRGSHLQVAEDVFEHHDRVIDQAGKGQR